MHREDPVFPFSAVVNQEQVKLALLLNAINPKVGGVLIRGRRGTAKSTLARGLSHLLPQMETVADCPFSCDPADIESLCGYCAGRLAVEGALPVAMTRMSMVTLPLNATEEMVVGTLDIEKALRRGEKSFEPGLLARANRAILYVDEVNLLEDHIVDILLDCAAMGINVIEREGISFKHSACFILVGTMNPEEGELRPQLEDRFGLCAEVDEECSQEDRSEVLKRNLSFSRNPFDFESQWHSEQEQLRQKILGARVPCDAVEISDEIVDAVTRITHHAGVDGHRADIAMLHSARALAAFESRFEVVPRDIERVARLALQHRMRKGPLGIGGSGRKDVSQIIEECRMAAVASSGEMKVGSGPPGASEDASLPKRAGAGNTESTTGGAPCKAKPRFPELELPGTAAGRRGQASANDSRGRYYRSAAPPAGKPPQSASDIAIDATIRASASRGGDDQGRPEVSPEDIKVKLRRRKCGSSILFVVDASASMGARKRLEASREAIMSLLLDAYQKRDRVGLVVFKDDCAQLVMSPTSSPALAGRLLENLDPGGTTPLSHGLALGCQVLDRELSRTPQPSPVMILISDGCGNVTLGASNPLAEALELAAEIKARGISSVVIDSASRRIDGAQRGRPTSARRISDALGADYFPLTEITGEAILERVNPSADRARLRVV